MSVDFERTEEPIDYWREVARRGVVALGFSMARAWGEPAMIAELVAPQDGQVQRAAHVAIELHKQIGRETGTLAHAAQSALATGLESGSSARELSQYQALLLERLWHEIEAAPAQTLERLSYPHED